ncbi:MAG: hypothetical protein WCF07_00445, partial [Nitrososphaeraceae archaeon]
HAMSAARTLFIVRVNEPKTKIGVNYLLPIQVDGDVEEMYLMIKLSKNLTSISRKSVADFINSVYTDVYDYRKTDLLRRTIANLPDVIDIQELKVRDL